MIFVFDWLTSFRMILSRSIHIAADEIISFFFMAKHYEHWGYMYLFELEFSLDICPGVGLLDYRVTILSVF